MNSVISISLFGRLSCLEIERSKLLEDSIFAQIEHDVDWQKRYFLENDIDKYQFNHGPFHLAFPRGHAYEKTKTYPNHIKIVESSINNLIFILYDDLVEILESIVLADKIAIFNGFDLNSIRGTTFGKLNSWLLPQGWFSIRYYPEVANELFDYIKNYIPTYNIYSKDKNGLISAGLLELVKSNVNILAFCDEKGNINEDALLDSFSDEYFDPVRDLNEIQNFINVIRGHEWIAYRNITKRFINRLPREFFRALSFSRKMGFGETLKFQRDCFALSLFEEARIAIDEGGIVFPNYGSKEYYKKILQLNNISAYDIRDIGRREYQNKIINELESKKIASINILVPQTVKACISGASSIKEAILNAIRLRRTKWAKNYRSYLKDLQYSYSPERKIREIRKIANYIDSGFDNRSMLEPGNITISIAGIFSLSISPRLSMKKKVTKNPFIYFQSKMSNLTKNTDSVSDLSKILKIERSEIVKWLIKRKMIKIL